MMTKERIRDVLASLCLLGALVCMLLIALDIDLGCIWDQFPNKGIVGVEVTDYDSLGEDFILNSGTVEDLQGLPGIGPVLAERIVAYREMNGPFRYIDHLIWVEGIGSKKLQSIREYLVEQGLYESQPAGTVTYENSP